MTRLSLSLADELEQEIIHLPHSQYQAHPLAGYKREYKWHPTRRFRADFAWTKQRLLVEVDGGQWIQGTGHNSGKGKERDCIKDCEALLLGWFTMRFTTNMVRDGRAVQYIKRYLES